MNLIVGWSLWFGSSCSGLVDLLRMMVDLLELMAGLSRMMAGSLQLVGRFDEAATVLTQAIERHPPQAMLADLHLRLGEIYEGSLDQPRKAIDHLKLAQQLLEPGFVRTQLAERIAELEKRLERDRLVREGKPIPDKLLPAADPHGH